MDPFEQEQITEDFTLDTSVLSTALCVGCSQQKSIDELTIVGRPSTAYCRECIQGYVKPCTNCSRYFFFEDPSFDYRNTDTGGRWQCDRCHRARSQRMIQRPHGTTVIGSGKGAVINSTRGWSTEIECYTTDIGELLEQFQKLPTSFGIDRDGSLEAKNGGSEGKETKDGKVLVKGVELTTPVLRGQKGEDYLTDICKALNYNDNTRVDFTTGMHIHLDMNDLRSDHEAVKRLMVFHWIYEGVIKSFLPASRRTNVFCQSTKNDYSVRKLATSQSMQEVHGLWYKGREGMSRYNKKHPRYHGINFHCFWGDEHSGSGHSEVRYHSGTTNPKKILAWAALHVQIIDFCAAKKQTCDELIANGITFTGKPRSLNRLTKQLFEMIELSDETKKYFLARQKKFKNDKNMSEVDFMERTEAMIEAKEAENRPPAVAPRGVRSEISTLNEF